RLVGRPIAPGVPFRPVQRIAGDVHRRYRFGTPGEVERERAVIAEAVQRAPACDLADESPILALVEKGPRLLSGRWSREVSHAVLLDLDPLGYRAAQQLDADRQLLFAAERDVVSGEDAVRLKQLLKHLDDDVAVGLETGAHELDDQPPVVPVADQGGAGVSLAVDDPERIGLF